MISIVEVVTVNWWKDQALMMWTMSVEVITIQIQNKTKQMLIRRKVSSLLRMVTTRMMITTICLQAINFRRQTHFTHRSTWEHNGALSHTQISLRRFFLRLWIRILRTNHRRTVRRYQWNAVANIMFLLRAPRCHCICFSLRQDKSLMNT